MSEDSSAVGFFPVKHVNSTLRKQMPTIIVGSLTLIATLAWNDAFRALIDQYIPEKYRNGKNAWFKILYALILTTIIVIIISIILRASP